MLASPYEERVRARRTGVKSLSGGNQTTGRPGPAAPARQTPTGSQCPEGILGGLGILGDPSLEAGCDQVVARGKAPIERRDANPGVLRDVLERDLEAMLREIRDRGLDDPIAVARGVGTEGAF
jgi:hypothetical protein